MKIVVIDGQGGKMGRTVIELVGKILFVAFLIPKFQYMAVIFCEPVIWCFMVTELLFAFWRNPFIKEGK